MKEEFMNIDERLALWQEEIKEGKKQNPIVNIVKLYVISVILNFIPIMVEYVRLDCNPHGDGAIGYYFFWIFFVIASIINLSFFFLIKKSVRDSKIMSFFTCYASSLFFLVIFICDIGTWGNFRYGSVWDNLFIAFFFNIYFIINFLLVFIYRKIIKFKQKNTQDEFIENKN